MDTPKVNTNYLEVTKDSFPDRRQEVALQQVEDQKIAAQKALEAAQAAEAQKQAELAAQVQSAPQQAYNGSDAKLFIYMHESGNNPKAQNGAGCLGLGQACPGSKLLAVCPTLDYACEDAFFTSYAIGRYGSWEAAAAFWRNNSWW